MIGQWTVEALEGRTTADGSLRSTLSAVSGISGSGVGGAATVSGALHDRARWLGLLGGVALAAASCSKADGSAKSDDGKCSAHWKLLLTGSGVIPRAPGVA